MGTYNVGNQLISWDYKTPLIGGDLAKVNHGVMYPGVYGSGLQVTKNSNTQVQVTTGELLIEDTAQLRTVKINFQSVFTATVSEPVSPSQDINYLVIRFGWDDREDNYADILSVDSIGSTDIVLAVITWTGTPGARTIDSVDNTSKTYGINTDIDGFINSLKPSTDLSATRTIDVAPGTFVYSAKSVTFAGDSITLDSTPSQRCDVMGVDDTGTLVVSKGTDGSLTPNAYGAFLPVAEVKVYSGQDIILAQDVKDVRSFQTYFGIVTASSVVVDPSGLQWTSSTSLQTALNNLSSYLFVGANHIKVNQISEYTVDNGVTVEGVLLKDGSINVTSGSGIGISSSNERIIFNSDGSINYYQETGSTGGHFFRSTEVDSCYFKFSVSGTDHALRFFDGSDVVLYKLSSSSNTFTWYQGESVTEIMKFNSSNYVEFAQGIETNSISELTSGVGVTVDGVLLKDNQVSFSNKYSLLTSALDVLGEFTSPGNDAAFTLGPSQGFYIDEYWDSGGSDPRAIIGMRGGGTGYKKMNIQFSQYYGWIKVRNGIIDIARFDYDGSIHLNLINELTSGVGVTIDGVLLRDSGIEAGFINEAVADAGVTVDGVLLKDGGVLCLNNGRNIFTIPNDSGGVETGYLLNNVSGTRFGFYGNLPPGSNSVAFVNLNYNTAGNDRFSWYQVTNSAGSLKELMTIDKTGLLSVSEIETDSISELTSGVGVTIEDMNILSNTNDVTLSTTKTNGFIFSSDVTYSGAVSFNLSVDSSVPIIFQNLVTSSVAEGVSLHSLGSVYKFVRLYVDVYLTGTEASLSGSANWGWELSIGTNEVTIQDHFNLQDAPATTLRSTGYFDISWSPGADTILIKPHLYNKGTGAWHSNTTTETLVVGASSTFGTISLYTVRKGDDDTWAFQAGTQAVLWVFPNG